MDALHIILLILIGAGAGFVQRVSGFGMGIFAMIFLPHFMPTHTDAAAISSLFSCVTSTYNFICYRKNVAYKTAVPMICAALISIPIAVHFSSVVSGDIFKILLGVMLIIISIYFIFFSKNIKVRPTFINGLLAGTLGGTLSGLFSTGGPPAVIYLNNATKDNITYFATIQFYFCFTNIYSTSTRILSGLITPAILLYSAIGLIGCVIGDSVGRTVFNRLDSSKLKIVIYAGMIFSGIIMLIR